MVTNIFNIYTLNIFFVLLMSSFPTKASTWRYAIEESLSEVQGIHATRFKEIIEANSNHKVQIYPYGTLGESSDVLEQTQAGILQFVTQSAGFTGSLIPEAQVFLLPYVLPEKQSELNYFFKHARVIKEDFKKLYAKQDLELLKMFPEGTIAITTKKEFRSPSELHGQKIRVQPSPLLVETYRAFGAVPTPLPWGEVFSALQTNMIQGQENPWFYIESGKLYEVTTVITEAGHNTFTAASMANKKFYANLPESDQRLVQQASEQALDFILEYQQGLTNASKQKIKRAKPEIVYVTLTETERIPFRKAAEQVKARFINMTGASGEKILQQLLADLNAAKNK